MAKKITVSAPGKLMLYGEHAVVYGRPCLVTAVNRRMKVTVELTDQPFFQLNAPDVSVTNYQKPMSNIGQGEIPKGAKFVEIALLNFIKKYSIKNGVKVTTQSEFNSQFGFGSSSASTVCMIKALSELTGKKLSDKQSFLSDKQIFDLSYKTVLDIQGKGSGFDVAAAIYGGTLYFVTPGKVIKPLHLSSLPLIVGYSGIKTDTVTLINAVAKKAEKFPKVIDNIYTSIGNLVNLAHKALLKEDLETAGQLMNFNEGYLSALEVEGKQLADMIYAARDSGAYGAKLSGAGMGDCMIALHSAVNKPAIKKAIAAAGGQVIDVKANAQGVRIEK